MLPRHFCESFGGQACCHHAWISALRFRKPWPENVETAYAVEKIIRDADAVPATMAILHDRMTSFLSAADIDYPVT